MTSPKTFTEFSLDYDRHGIIDKVGSIMKPTKPLNIKQVKRYYGTYLRKWYRAHKDSINESPTLSRDAQLSIFIRERDIHCRLLQVLTQEEYTIWQQHSSTLGKILDAAHVFGKGAYPHLRYDARNIVLLNRFSHSCLDTNRCPITGHLISLEEKLQWWHRIVGSDWDYLVSKSILLHSGRGMN